MYHWNNNLRLVILFNYTYNSICFFEYLYFINIAILIKIKNSFLSEILMWIKNWFCCSLDENAQRRVKIDFFEVENSKKLTKETRRLVKEDVVLRHMLIVEFATNPRQIHSAIELSKLVGAFFDPLLFKTRNTLAVQMLQFRYKEILTIRLLGHDTKCKVVIRFLNFCDFLS